MAVATHIEGDKKVVNRICAEANAIPMGTVMKLSGDNLVIASSGATDSFGGITIEEFTGGEGLTHVACAMGGTWDIDTTAAAIATGQAVNIEAANQVILADEAAWVAGSFVGWAESTRTGTDRIRVRLRG